MTVADRFHRVIRLSAAADAVDARVQDNVHDFKVRLRHDGVHIRSVEADTVRSPFTTCEGARRELGRIVGHRIGHVGRPRVEMALQCTHMFDLAVLAGVHAARGGERTYKVDGALGEAGAGDIRMTRDGEASLAWRVENDHIVTPGVFEGLSRGGPIRWPDAVIGDPELMEAAQILRRSLLVLFGRRRSQGVYQASTMAHMTGACYTFQSEPMQHAVRPPGFRDYSTEDLLENLLPR